MAMNNTILSRERMRMEIEESHKRSARLNICREERLPDQERLSPELLEERRNLNADFLEVAYEYIEEFYDLLSPDRFIIAVVDREGYILHLSGSDAIKAEFTERNYAPGYRFTEEDVGTTATSLCLKKKIPVQLNDKDHYCQRAHGFTSSAAPILGRDGELQGALVVSGKSRFVHIHTLIMVTSAARSIERQIRLVRRNRELSVYSNFLANVVESAETGMLTLDNDYWIWMTNRKAKQILGQEKLDGKPISILNGLDVDLADLYAHPDAWKEKACYVECGGSMVHIVYSAQPVISARDKKLGAVVVFEELRHIKKITDKLSGNKAFFTFDHLKGRSPSFAEAKSLARRAAQSDSTVLLLGETGTGKELFAQAIHNEGPLKTGPFVPVNCGAIPGELMESEMFGYVDGAFSGALKGGRPGRFELADGGTLLLDEIGDMPHTLQVKLLRVLQTGEVQRIGSDKLIKVDVRIIASTNVDLQEAIRRNRFRQDLYYRLNILPITIPPLRERGTDDIRDLALHFIEKYNPFCELTPDALDMMLAYHWPGNVRELENTIQRALHLCDGRTIQAEHIGLVPKTGSLKPDLSGTLQEMEQALIRATLEQHQFNMAISAASLGISRATLYRKVKTYAIRIR